MLLLRFLTRRTRIYRQCAYFVMHWLISALSRHALYPRISNAPIHQAILDELKLVLEEDAAVFMVKMWRMLVFCTLRTQERAQS